MQTKPTQKELQEPWTQPQANYVNPSDNQEERKIALQYISFLGAALDRANYKILNAVDNKQNYILKQHESWRAVKDDIEDLIDDLDQAIRDCSDKMVQPYLKDCRKTAVGILNLSKYNLP